MSQTSIHNPQILLRSIFLYVTFSDLDVKEIETVRSKQIELEDKISSVDANLKSLQATLRQKEDEAAELQRERVSKYT